MNFLEKVLIVPGYFERLVKSFTVAVLVLTVAVLVVYFALRGLL